MKKADVQIGGTYMAKVSGKIVPVKILAAAPAHVAPYGGWEATNIKTGRAVHVKSAQRLRRPWTDVGQKCRLVALPDGRILAVLGSGPVTYWRVHGETDAYRLASPEFAAEIRKAEEK